MDYIPSNIQKNWMGLMEYSWDIHGVFLVFFFSSLGQPYRTVAGWIFRYWPSKKRGCQPMNRGIYTKINCRNQQMAISKCRAWSLFILFFGGWFSVKCQLFDLFMKPLVGADSNIAPVPWWICQKVALLQWHLYSRKHVFPDQIILISSSRI